MVWVPYPTSCTHQSLYSIWWSWLRWEVNILPPVLKADSEATIVIGIAKTSLAIAWKVRNFNPFIFHHDRISNSGVTDKLSSSN